MAHGPISATYVLPIAASSPQTRALSGYLRRLSRIVDDVIVVDGSPLEVFETHARSWASPIRHVRPALKTTNGKVAGVLTGVRSARHERMIIADDDVRYRRASLARMVELLGAYDVVRPQNFFRPMPWHARWDTARSLLNRLGDGDWPGTLGIRRSILIDTGGYSGEVLFENLEMVRTIQAAGGKESVPLDLFVERRPPDLRHFLSQRVRQAYDEWARPGRLAAQMALLPLILVLGWNAPMALAVAAGTGVAAAEIGRRRSGGRHVFPASSACWAPLWLTERSITSWIAFLVRICAGGVRYRETRLKRAATSLEALKRARALCEDLGSISGRRSCAK
jgi:hypothetical protein